MNDLVVKIFKYLGWILYLGLFLTAILFTREAMEKFFSGDTGITLSEEKIDLQQSPYALKRVFVKENFLDMGQISI